MVPCGRVCCSAAVSTWPSKYIDRQRHAPAQPSIVFKGQHETADWSWMLFRNRQNGGSNVSVTTLLSSKNRIAQRLDPNRRSAGVSFNALVYCCSTAIIDCRTPSVLVLTSSHQIGLTNESDISPLVWRPAVQLHRSQLGSLAPVEDHLITATSDGLESKCRRSRPD